jgi:hypothetical protein
LKRGLSSFQNHFWKRFERRHQAFDEWTCKSVLWQFGVDFLLIRPELPLCASKMIAPEICIVGKKRL